MSVRDQLNGGDTTRWDPMSEFNRLTQQLAGLFGEQWPALSAAFNGDAFTPVSDIEEADDAYLVEIELPSVRKKDVVIEVDDHQLVVRGERRAPVRAGRLRHRARSWGRFRYEVRLPELLDAEATQAMLQDGVLRVRIPKNRIAHHRHVATKGGKP